ncbi:MAG: hypothetical protein MHPSP_003775, partial [Paramarteilia canceri]
MSLRNSPDAKADQRTSLLLDDLLEASARLPIYYQRELSKRILDRIRCDLPAELA